MLQDERRFLTVSELLGRLGGLLDEQPDLQDLVLRGEVTNWVRSRPGHCYFSLKDDQAQVRCVLFAREATGLSFEPCDGRAVQVWGSVTLYKPRGDLQVRVRRMAADGAGALYEALERLRRKLEAEGLFAQDRKRPLPPYPRVIGVVTSEEGAVLHDIRTTLARRNPSVRLLLSPSQVQGPGAEEALVRALKRLEVRPEVDCVIVARGGGSLEDLKAFNSEAVVRAVAECPVPVVSAVGHETDVTLCDLAADLRAPTPTAAAELVAPARDDLLAGLQQFRDRMTRALTRHLQVERHLLEGLQARPCLRFPLRGVEGEIQRLDALADALRRSLARRLQGEREALEAWGRALLRQHPQARVHRDLEGVRALQVRLERAVGTLLRRDREGLERLQGSPSLRDPFRLLRPRQEGLRGLRTLLERAATRACTSRRERLEAARDRLVALSPLGVLDRGYALVLDPAGRVVSSWREVSVGEALQVRLRDGALGVTVKDVEDLG